MTKPMSNKTPGMQDAIESLFPGTRKLIEEHRCPMCKKSIDMQGFKDKLSYKEFMISGMCQVCQDSIWGEKDDPE